MIAKRQTSTAVKVVLSDTDKKTKKDAIKNKRGLLVGKSWDTLKAKEKDDLLRLACEQLGLIDAAGTVL